MLFDIGRIIGGPGQGDGPAGAILNLFSGLAVLGGGGLALAGAGDIGVDGAAAGVFTDVGGAAAHAGKGVFASVMEMFAETDWILDGLLFKQYQQSRHGNTGAGASGKNANPEFEHLADIVTGHSFFLSQLKEHQDKPNVKALYEEYEKLGLNLPSQELLRKAHRALSPYLSTDINKGISVELPKFLHAGRDALKNESNRARYNEELSRNEPGIREFFEQITQKLETMHGAPGAQKAAQAAATGTSAAIAVTGATGASANGWFSKLNRPQQAGVVFAGAAVAAIGVYWIAHTLETRRKKRLATPQEFPASHAERLRADAAQPDTAQRHSRS